MLWERIAREPADWWAHNATIRFALSFGSATNHEAAIFVDETLFDRIDRLVLLRLQRILQATMRR